MNAYSVVPLGAVARITVEGHLDFASTRDLVLDVARNANAKDKNLLVDIRGVRSRLTFPEVYRVVKVILDHPRVFRGRIALLDDYNAEFEKAQFFEASSLAAGVQAKTFLDEDQAIAWVNGEM